MADILAFGSLSIWKYCLLLLQHERRDLWEGPSEGGSKLGTFMQQLTTYNEKAVTQYSACCPFEQGSAMKFPRSIRTLGLGYFQPAASNAVTLKRLTYSS
jgi:hypothetical protein